MDWNLLSYDDAVVQLRKRFGFDFASIGLAPSAGEALRWLHVSGATSERYKRIVLSPGHGVGGIVLKAGKPMMFTDIDTQLDPRDYSSYPIVFAEDLHSFVALPLESRGLVEGVLLCGFRSSDRAHRESLDRCIEEMADGLCGFNVRTEGFLAFDELSQEGQDANMSRAVDNHMELVEAREDERRAISRELHDVLAQELLSVSMLIKQMGLLHSDEATMCLVRDAENGIDRLLDQTRNLSVQLRPLALDDLGLVPALRAQADVYRKMFGADICIRYSEDRHRYDQVIETHVYRIAQEAMLNACKYSNSDVVDVIVADDGDILSVAVCDQGNGFDVEHPTVLGHGCGMHNMRERAAVIGASLNVFSGPEGTTVSLCVPLK